MWKINSKSNINIMEEKHGLAVTLQIILYYESITRMLALKVASTTKQ